MFVWGVCYHMTCTISSRQVLLHTHMYSEHTQVLYTPLTNTWCAHSIRTCCDCRLAVPVQA